MIVIEVARLAPAVGAAPVVGAQGVPGAGRGRAMPGPRYDTKTVQNIDATVIRVDAVAGRPGLAGGVHLITLVGTDTLPVHLGPTWYLAQETIKFAAGDKIRVRGSRTTFEGKPAFIAAEVRHAGGARLVLRDRQGVPRWGRQPAAGGGCEIHSRARARGQRACAAAAVPRGRRSTQGIVHDEG